MIVDLILDSLRNAVLIAGLVVVLVILVREISDLFDLIKSLFGL